MFFAIIFHKTFQQSLHHYSLVLHIPMVQWFELVNLKNFIWPFWSSAFCKNILINWYCNTIMNFKFMVFIIMFNFKTKMCTCLNINRFHFDCSMIFIIVFVKYLLVLFVKALINLSVTTDWFCYYILNKFLLHCLVTMNSLIFCKIHFLY